MYNDLSGSLYNSVIYKNRTEFKIEHEILTKLQYKREIVYSSMVLLILFLFHIYCAIYNYFYVTFAITIAGTMISNFIGRNYMRLLHEKYAVDDRYDVYFNMKNDDLIYGGWNYGTLYYTIVLSCIMVFSNMRYLSFVVYSLIGSFIMAITVF